MLGRSSLAARAVPTPPPPTAFLSHAASVWADIPHPHSLRNTPQNSSHCGCSIHNENPHTEFHTYTVHWTPEAITFFFNDTPYFTFANEGKTRAEWPFDQPQYLKLNLAIGGAWGGIKGIDETALPLQMEVDYVRVYQKP